MSKPKRINDGNFDEEVLKANKPVLVNFSAKWAQLSRVTESYIIEIAKEYSDFLKVCIMDVDKNQSTTSRYGVTNIPTSILFEDGKIKKSVKEYIPKAELLNTLELNKF
jgi:thioredoxin 1